MTKRNKPDAGQEEIISDWMKTAGDVWNEMFRSWVDMGRHYPFQESVPKGDSGSRKASSMNAAIKSFQVFSNAFFEPTVIESLLKGSGAMPEILAKMSQSALTGFMHMQQKWVERAGKIGKTTEAFKFEDLDENAFRAWSEIYEKEFRQFFNIPQLGLTRLYQEKMNRAADKFTIFQSTFAEFLRLLYLPISRSFTVLQEQLLQMVESGTLPEEAKTYYQMWIKILEGHYMTLFQSPEYIQTLGKTLETMSAFSLAKNAVIEDALNSLPIPKQKEMDELYQELYLLKKRVKALEK